MIFRLSEKLKSKIKAEPLASLPLNENPLVDWSAGLFLVGRSQYIIVTNTKSLFSTVLTAKGISNTSKFIEYALAGIREVLEYYELEAIFDRMTSTSVRFGKALDRSVTGSMNNLIKYATYWLADDEFPLDEVRMRLNEIPMSAVGIGASYGIPARVFGELVSSVDRCFPPSSTASRRA
jgi:hypothetical protein